MSVIVARTTTPRTYSTDPSIAVPARIAGSMHNSRKTTTHRVVESVTATASDIDPTTAKGTNAHSHTSEENATALVIMPITSSTETHNTTRAMTTFRHPATRHRCRGVRAGSAHVPACRRVL